MVTKSKARVQWPWFILFLCLAAIANSYVPILHALYPVLAHLGVTGLTVTLYLIGTGLSMATLRQVGVRPLLQGIVLWAIVGFGTLELIRLNWIHLYSAKKAASRFPGFHLIVHPATLRCLLPHRCLHLVGRMRQCRGQVHQLALLVQHHNVFNPPLPAFPPAG